MEIISSLRIVCFLLGGIFLQGCTSGQVHDALTDVAIESVVIEVVVGDCIGAGCAETPVHTLTDSFGSYNFNGYELASRQWIIPSAGHEAIELRISKAGYETVTIFHRPRYQKFTIADTDYLASIVGKVYLCLQSSLDSDGDSICDDAEIRYGTDPENSDSDGDRLSDAAEIYGYNGVDLRHFGANPLRKDVFVEIDYYPNRKPETDAIQRVVDAFAVAPVLNPDGSSGINLVASFSDEIDPADVDPDIANSFEFSLIRNKYFPDRRSAIFHYSLFAERVLGSIFYNGVSWGIPARDFVVALGGIWGGGTPLQQAGTFMHELGHNLGLSHGGYNDGTNLKPNYLSVMNYYYQTWGLRVDGVDGILDYSRLQIDAVDETSLNEQLALKPVPGSDTTEAELARYSVFANGGYLNGNASENLDFNRNDTIEESVSVDLDGVNGASTAFRASKKDWNLLTYSGGGGIGDANLGSVRQSQDSSFIFQEQVEGCKPRLDYGIR
jgi:hypothetical protein